MKLDRQKLREARLDRNLTQAQLAELAGVSETTVKRMEHGWVSTNLQSLQRITYTLGLSIDAVLLVDAPEVPA